MEIEKIVVGEKCIPKLARIFNTLAEPQSKNAIISANDTYNKIKNKMTKIEKEKLNEKKEDDKTIIKPEDVEKMMEENEVQYIVNRNLDKDEK